MSLISRFLVWLSAKLPKRSIYERNAQDVYLERYYLFGRAPADWEKPDA